MIALSGQLGNGALGAFVLARPRTARTFDPNRRQAKSTVTANTPKSEVTAGP